MGNGCSTNEGCFSNADTGDLIIESRIVQESSKPTAILLNTSPENQNQSPANVGETLQTEEPPEHDEEGLRIKLDAFKDVRESSSQALTKLKYSSRNNS